MQIAESFRSVIYVTITNPQRDLSSINQELSFRAKTEYNTTYENGMMVGQKSNRPDPGV